MAGNMNPFHEIDLAIVDVGILLLSSFYKHFDKS